jgi:hypothetical protein
MMENYVISKFEKLIHFLKKQNHFLNMETDPRLLTYKTMYFINIGNNIYASCGSIFYDCSWHHHIDLV